MPSEISSTPNKMPRAEIAETGQFIKMITANVIDTIPEIRTAQKNLLSSSAKDRTIFAMPPKRNKIAPAFRDAAFSNAQSDEQRVAPTEITSAPFLRGSRLSVIPQGGPISTKRTLRKWRLGPQLGRSSKLQRTTAWSPKQTRIVVVQICCREWLIEAQSSRSLDS